MHRKLVCQIKIQIKKTVTEDTCTHIQKVFTLKSHYFIATVGRSNVSLFDRQNALGMIDDETNTCEDVKQ